MKAISRNIGWVWKSAILIAIIVSGYLLIRLVSGTTIHVPKEFLEARVRGGEFADHIVRLSEESIQNLRLISENDAANKYREGLERIKEELARNEVARDSALKLSKELVIMANSLQDIKPADSSKPGLEAIIVESQIVQYLISYNNNIYQLIELLRVKFLNPAKADNEKIRIIIAEMNREAEAVNNLNEKYKELMSEFDELTQKVK